MYSTDTLFCDPRSTLPVADLVADSAGVLEATFEVFAQAGSNPCRRSHRRCRRLRNTRGSPSRASSGTLRSSTACRYFSQNAMILRFSSLSSTSVLGM